MSKVVVLIAGLHALPGMTWRTFHTLINQRWYERPASSWSISQLIAAGIQPDRATQLLQTLPQLNLRQAEERLQQSGATLITRHDRQYPPLLKEIASAPPVLYVRGNIGLLQKRPAVAVVGTRRPTPYGVTVTEKLVAPLASAGVSIISGLALGIDAVAHQTALDHHGRTIAVLGSGVDVLYPLANRDLAQQILEHHGAIVSEFPLGSSPERHHFPQRNRIISGLSSASLIVEAGQKSGALITAKFALEQNRELLAVPGSILSDQSRGTNSWLRLGAQVVTSPQDIFEILNIPASKPFQPSFHPPKPRTQDEERLLSLVGPEPIHVDELSKKSRLDSSRVTAILALMEINGMVRHVGGMYYCLGIS